MAETSNGKSGAWGVFLSSPHLTYFSQNVINIIFIPKSGLSSVSLGYHGSCLLGSCVMRGE